MVLCVQIPKHKHFFSLQQHKKEVLRAALNPFGVRSQKVKPNASFWVSEGVDCKHLEMLFPYHI